MKAPRIALFGPQKTPIVGVYHRLKAVITAPTQMVLDYRKDHGDLFTVRIPFKFDLTYFLTKEGCAAVLGLSAEEGRIGEVFLNVPCVGSSFPRSDMGADYVQTLVMAGRSFMASELLDKSALESVPRIVHKTVDEHVSRWGGTIDLSTDFVELAFDASARACVGEKLWTRLEDEARPLLRDIVDGIDIPRAAFNTMPIRVFGKEYRASRRLHRLLVQVREEHERTGAHPIFDRIAAIELRDGRRLPSEDVPWMLMYILWNAVSYPGSYSTWALADIARHPSACAHAASLEADARRRFYAECFEETA
ncbi:MAG: hypothetical protein H5U40_03355, partial [Polyangiaceae bacterium]|nr:hypothetical protein [Polyangiaceae bacterium]